MTGRSTVVLVVLGLALGACGDDGQQSRSPADETTTTSAAPDTSPTTAPTDTTATTAPTDTTATTATTASTTTTTGKGLSDESRLVFDGIGPVKVGMTLAQASAAVAKPVEVDPNYVLDGCAYAAVTGGPKGLSFMVLRDRDSDPWRIVRVDVDDESRIATQSGIRIGATEAEVKRTYGAPGRTGKITIENHEYVEGGHYISYDDDGPAGLRMLFETDGQKVTRFRSGQQGPVGYVEGCA
ncbi:MAG TPA: hypothetical protein VFS16_19325 [Acidimicrobiia bacterium]|nr:hypothetical protein [Acidimicrobiia bacterium]